MDNLPDSGASVPRIVRPANIDPPQLSIEDAEVMFAELAAPKPLRPAADINSWVVRPEIDFDDFNNFDLDQPAADSTLSNIEASVERISSEVADLAHSIRTLEDDLADIRAQNVAIIRILVRAFGQGPESSEE